MTQARFLQIHTLASYPATLLNRDDSGLAKRLPFGDAMRTRISSQCLKRHWRKPADDSAIQHVPWALQNLNEPMGVRSREVPERRLLAPLEAENIATPEIRKAVSDAFAVQLYGKNAAKDKSSRQALLLGQPEIDYLLNKARAIAGTAADAKAADEAVTALFKTEKGNLASLKKRGVMEAGLEAALFGRMVTSDPESNTNAAIHVAHAFTVHGEATESDYFTVVDDLTREANEAGTAGLFDTELTAGLFYGYVVVDVPLLVANVGNDAALAGRIIEHLIHLIATVSPGAKKGSTAPYAYAELMMIEAGSRQPRTLANAYRSPSRADIADATTKLAEHLTKIDAAYGSTETRRHMSVERAGLPSSSALPFDQLAAFARDTVAAWQMA